VFPNEWCAEFSQEQCALFEVEPHEASHELFVSRVHDDDRERVTETIEQLMSGASHVELQYRIATPSGRVLHLLNRTRVDHDRDGHIVRIIGANLDITERVEREASLNSALSEIRELRDRLEEENVRLREAVRSIEAFEQIVGESDSLRANLDLAARAAPMDVPVLILGETGKELIAKAIHNLSLRKDKPLISLNCAALPAHLVESELFGHERGAFTGAHASRQGRFELADGGTLFMDEIADLPLQLQGRLLRVLQDGSFDRLGSARTRSVDVRLIAASNRDLREAVKAGEFRADLYYRINTIQIELPPLRERRGDITLLAHHFVRKHGPRVGKNVEYISADMLHFLQEQDWPGNVRELEHFIERALISSRDSVLTLGAQAKRKHPGRYRASGRSEIVSADLRSMERRHILHILEETGWTISGNHGAAARLKLPPSTLRSKMKRLGIQRRS
jgi:formate hydrogenlyase transcriptional activator